eukprot:Gb_11630 [translate_table: standard]
MKTDPMNSDYIVESGATRNFEPWRAEDEEADNEKKKRDAEEMGDAMKSLENRTIDSKREMDILAALDEMKSMRARHATISTDAMLEALRHTTEEKEKKLEEEDEALIKSLFLQESKNLVRRLNDDEDEDEYGDAYRQRSEMKGKSTGELKILSKNKVLWACFGLSIIPEKYTILRALFVRPVLSIFLLGAILRSSKLSNPMRDQVIHLTLKLLGICFNSMQSDMPQNQRESINSPKPSDSTTKLSQYCMLKRSSECVLPTFSESSPSTRGKPLISHPSRVSFFKAIRPLKSLGSLLHRLKIQFYQRHRKLEFGGEFKTTCIKENSHERGPANFLQAYFCYKETRNSCTGKWHALSQLEKPRYDPPWDPSTALLYPSTTLLEQLIDIKVGLSTISFQLLNDNRQYRRLSTAYEDQLGAHKGTIPLTSISGMEDDCSEAPMGYLKVKLVIHPGFHISHSHTGLEKGESFTSGEVLRKRDEKPDIRENGENPADILTGPSANDNSKGKDLPVSY